MENDSLQRGSRVEFASPVQPQTKLCPFCAEVIQARAVKCRFCNEFLNIARAKASQEESQQQPQPDGEKPESNVLFKAKPSLLGMAGSFVKGSFFLAIAVFLINFPLEDKSWLPFNQIEEPGSYEDSAWLEIQLDRQQATQQQVGFYRRTAGFALVFLVVLGLCIKVVKLKMTSYEVTKDRIEYSRGILDRKVDNLDMFRVIDIKLRKSFLDCVFGIGAVGLITTDKSDPEFTFEKIRNSRRLYDVIKKASLEADRQQGVIHLE